MNNKFCRYCGTENNYDYIFCKKCGKPLDTESGNASNPYGNPNAGGYSYGNPYANAPYQSSPYNTPPYGNPLPDTIDGVNTEDVAIFLGKDSRKYLPIFAGIETKSRNGLNLLVLLLSVLVSPLFAAFWFMHKRMNKIGLFIFLIFTAFEFGNLIAAFSVVKEVFTSIAMFSDVDQATAIMLNQIESNSLLSALSSVSQLVSLVIAVVSGIFANKWYKNHVISTIKSITAENEESYKRALVEKGGTKNALWITLLVLTFVAIIVLSMIHAANIVSSVI